ncbi:MAG: class I SAM-dependent methyltransferase [Nitrospinae bacterium]|nr:class I SAM-dependent methyltransferase [Nitrospinota bacterium]MBF0634240.1 class I SAM-dependent methyltransferase [Nitrospinota bacterium]
MSGLFPPPLKFPAGVEDPVQYFYGRVEEILKAPPLLSADALEDPLFEGADGVKEALSSAQEALGKGRLSDSLALLNLCAVNHPHASALAGLACYALGLVEKSVFFWESISHMIPKDVNPSLYSSLVNLGRWIVISNPAFHPETDAFSIFCSGRGLDVGCGGKKTCPQAIGVDIVGGGFIGQYGGQVGVKSMADVTASGDYMPMFGDGEMDFVIARHNMEHYKDHVKALLEWVRVLKQGGLLAVAVPDHDWVDTINIDPTHRHVFTADSLDRLFGLLPGMKTVYAGGLIPRWSLLAVAQKTPAPKPYDYMAAALSRDMERVARRMNICKKGGRDWLARECQLELSRMAGETRS